MNVPLLVYFCHFFRSTVSPSLAMFLFFVPSSSPHIPKTNLKNFFFSANFTFFFQRSPSFLIILAFFSLRFIWPLNFNWRWFVWWQALSLQVCPSPLPFYNSRLLHPPPDSLSDNALRLPFIWWFPLDIRRRRCLVFPFNWPLFFLVAGPFFVWFVSFLPSPV